MPRINAREKCVTKIGLLREITEHLDIIISFFPPITQWRSLEGRDTIECPCVEGECQFFSVLKYY